MKGLKDFQQATVERVYSLYKKGQNRVLVADEVGLGKTLVAKGVIAKTARYYKEDLNDELFKVVYICSNQNIANQNIKIGRAQRLNSNQNINKLKISRDVTVDGVTDTRLSMQHLKIFEQEHDQNIKDKYIQLIPLTPSTSFSMTSGCGSVEERALIFAVLKRMPVFKDYIKELEIILIDWATSSWRWASTWYEKRVVACDKGSDGEYIKTVHNAINEYFGEKHIDKELVILCQKVRANAGSRIGGTAI